MHSFTYHRPDTLEQALAMLADHDGARPLAGGHTLLPIMKQRLANPPVLVDLARILGLDEVTMAENTLMIGAMVRHETVQTSEIVQKAIPALAWLAGKIGDPAVRKMGTIGGSIANNDPSADYPAACLALDATIITNNRRIAADEFFTGLFSTALKPTEIITAVSFPIPSRAAYQKLRNQASRYALVGVFVAQRDRQVRVAVTGASSKQAFRVRSFEHELERSFSPQSLIGLTVPTDDIIDDIHGSGRYRAHLINVLGRRAVAEAAKN